MAVKNSFHVVSNDPNRIAFLRAGAFCNACHDVRVPNRNLTAGEHNMNPGGQSVNYFRLENLSTEWQIGLYNSTNNPFGKVVRCQDCHMSLFPYAGATTYQVGDMTVTSPTPGMFAQLCREFRQTKTLRCSNEKWWSTTSRGSTFLWRRRPN